jgi:hypothetical protein
MFQKFRSQLKIIGARQMSRGKLHTEDPPYKRSRHGETGTLHYSSTAH